MTITITLDWYHPVLIALFLHLVYRWGHAKGWRSMRYTLEAAQEKLNYYEAAVKCLDQFDPDAVQNSAPAATRPSEVLPFRRA